MDGIPEIPSSVPLDRSDVDARPLVYHPDLQSARRVRAVPSGQRRDAAKPDLSHVDGNWRIPAVSVASIGGYPGDQRVVAL